MAYDKVVDSTVLNGLFTAIANAIRAKNGSQDTYTPAQMPQAIRTLPGECDAGFKQRIEAPTTDPGTPAFVWPPGVSEIGEYAFYHYPNYTGVDLVIPEGVEQIRDSAFYSSMIRSVQAPSTASFTGGNHFKSCFNLISADLSRIAGRTQIGGSAFEGDSALTEIKFPADTGTVQSKAFKNCSACLTFDFSRAERIPALSGTSAFDNINANAQIIVPDDLYAEWITKTNWSNSNIVAHIVKASEA